MAARTFIIKIVDEQNTTWQGTVTWADSGRTEAFRSLLELIRLVDSTEQEEKVS